MSIKDKKTTLLFLGVIFVSWLLIGAVVPALAQESATGQATADSLNQQTTTAGNTATEAEEDLQPPPEQSHQPGLLDFLMTGRYLAFLIMAVVAFILLIAGWAKLWVRIAMLVIAFVLFGIEQIYPMHPSPMCAVTKLFMFKFTFGQFFMPFIALVVAMFLPSLIGQKIFCGWVCPLGAFQDLINKIPFKYKIKNFNFAAFNAIRITLLVLFVLTFFYVKDHITYLAEELGADVTEQTWKIYSSYSLYDPINFFELLHWDLAGKFIVMLVVIVGASLVLYRPFCYIICPIGLLTWLCEKIAPGRIRVDHAKCTLCGDCEAKSPCPTIHKLVYEESEKGVIPDCTSCGECMNACPEDAISFRFKK
ncbi:MAG: 4Fe-4S binding protein [Candidatus Zixiibacteriota bacterium]